MFVSLFKPVEMGIHVIIALVAGAWLGIETIEFEELTESKVNSPQVSIQECELGVEECELSVTATPDRCEVQPITMRELWKLGNLPEEDFEETMNFIGMNPDQKIGPGHMDTFMASMHAFEEKLDKEMRDIVLSITPEEAEIMLEVLKEDDSITPQEFQELVQVIFTPENQAHLTKKGLLP